MLALYLALAFAAGVLVGWAFGWLTADKDDHPKLPHDPYGSL